jgi:hypothetical protein
MSADRFTLATLVYTKYRQALRRTEGNQKHDEKCKSLALALARRASLLRTPSRYLPSTARWQHLQLLDAIMTFAQFVACMLYQAAVNFAVDNGRDFNLYVEARVQLLKGIHHVY